MASPDAPNTGPKPFVLVLMPFAKEFNDVYTFGIKGAAEDVGAYAERVDEQIFEERILDHIFEQIEKADVIVADMSGQNPNVFYEVGYAHALKKTVVLLTSNVNDIPFDLKHHQHIVYSGQIGSLRADLVKRLTWAIQRSRPKRGKASFDQFVLSCSGVEIPEWSLEAEAPEIQIEFPNSKGGWGKARNQCTLPFVIKNESAEMSEAIPHLYLFIEETAPLSYRSQAVQASSTDASKLGLSIHYRLEASLNRSRLADLKYSPLIS
jgi:hypothetical protein